MTAMQVQQLQQQIASHPIQLDAVQHSSKQKAAKVLPRSHHQRIIAKLALVVATLAPSDHIAVRAIKLLPLLYLLHKN
jgi:hypothetical protein